VVMTVLCWSVPVGATPSVMAFTCLLAATSGHWPFRSSQSGGFAGVMLGSSARAHQGLLHGSK
jgi:hypothetical protein